MFQRLGLIVILILLSSVSSIDASTISNPPVNGWDDRFGCRLQGDVQDVIVFKDQLYAVGLAECLGVSSPLFDVPHHDSKGSLFRWNGTFWEMMLPNNNAANFSDVVVTPEMLYFATFQAPLETGELVTNGEIVAFDGTSSTVLPLPEGVTSWSIDDIALFQGDLYAVGWYITSDHRGAGVFRYHNGSWTWLRDVLENPPFTNVPTRQFAAGKNYLYLYSSFEFKDCGCGTSFHNLGRWDGQTWELLYNDFLLINSLAVIGDQVYVSARDEFNNYSIETFQDSTWVELDPAVDWGPVRMSVLDDQLYVYGPLANSTGQSEYKIARWSGAEWLDLASTVPQKLSYSNPPVFLCQFCSLIKYQDSFVLSGNMGGTSVWLLHDDRWSPLSRNSFDLSYTESATDQSGLLFHSMLATDQGLYFGGPFNHVAGTLSQGNAFWNGQAWEDWSVGLTLTTTNNFFESPVIFSDTTSVIHNMPSHGRRVLQRSPDGTWSVLAASSHAKAFTHLVWWQDSLFAFGSFAEINGVPAQNVARWDGSTWHAVGAGLSGLIHNVHATPHGMYALVLGASNYELWLWNGSEWSLITGIAYRSFELELKLAWFDNTLYLMYPSGLMRLNGTAWEAVPDAPRYIFDLEVGHDGLYAAGDFCFSKNNPVGIARWDGSQWHSVGGDQALTGWVEVPYYLCQPVVNIEIAGRNLYVLGHFTGAGGLSSPLFAIWHNPEGPNSPPHAQSYTFNLARGESVDLDLLADAWDLDYDPLAVSYLSVPLPSFVTSLDHRRIRITAPLAGPPTQTMFYGITDGHGSITSAQITINMPPNYAIYLPFIH